MDELAGGAEGVADEPETLIDVIALAKALGASTDFVYDAAGEGRIPFYRVGRVLRFRLSEVLAALRVDPKVTP